VSSPWGQGRKLCGPWGELFFHCRRVSLTGCSNPSATAHTLLAVLNPPSPLSPVTQSPLVFNGSNILCQLSRRFPPSSPTTRTRGSPAAALSFVATSLVSTVLVSDTQLTSLTGVALPDEVQTRDGTWSYLVYGLPELTLHKPDSALVFTAPIFHEEPGLSGDVYDGQLYACPACAPGPLGDDAHRRLASPVVSLSPTASFPFVVYSHSLMGFSKCVPSAIKTEGGVVRVVGSFVPPALGYAAVTNTEVIILWLTTASLTAPMTISRGVMDEGGSTIITTAPPYPVRLLLSAQDPQSTVTMLFSFNGGRSFSTFSKLSYSFDYFMTPSLVSISRTSGGSSEHVKGRGGGARNLDGGALIDVRGSPSFYVAVFKQCAHY
jgi:hypothetical protein